MNMKIQCWMRRTVPCHRSCSCNLGYMTLERRHCTFQLDNLCKKMLLAVWRTCLGCKRRMQSHGYHCPGGSMYHSHKLLLMVCTLQGRPDLTQADPLGRKSPAFYRCIYRRDIRYNRVHQDAWRTCQDRILHKNNLWPQTAGICLQCTKRNQTQNCSTQFGRPHTTSRP